MVIRRIKQIIYVHSNLSKIKNKIFSICLQWLLEEKPAILF